MSNTIPPINEVALPQTMTGAEIIAFAERVDPERTYSLSLELGTILNFPDYPLSIDLGRRLVTSNVGELLPTITEFDILAYLALNCDNVRSKEDILREIRGPNAVGMYAPNLIPVHTRNLKKRLAEELEVEPIRTVWGIGFMFSSSPK